MRALLDSHAFLWFVRDGARLSANARSFITGADELFLSIASIWEIGIKVSLGKLQVGQRLDQFFPQQLHLNQISVLPIDIAHALRVATLPHHHRDPFDRMLVAQSLVEGMPLVSVEALFDEYGIQRIW
jgi:PIN domain nuclease of toxin-antitoxin system